MTWPAAWIEQPAAVELDDGRVPAPTGSGSVLPPDGRRMLEAIDRLPEDKHEVFGLVPVQAPDAGRGGRGSRLLRQDRAAAVEPFAGSAGEGAESPPAVV